MGARSSSTYLETKAARLQAQGKQEAKLARKLERELEWVRSSPSARQAKNKARLERYKQMASEAANMKGVDFTDIHIPPGPRLGTQVLEVKDLCKGFGERGSVRQALVFPAAQRHCGHHRPQRRWQDHLV